MGITRILPLVMALGLAGPALAQEEEVPAAEADTEAEEPAKIAKAMKHRKDFIYDRGIENDPYTHMRGLTDGRIESFRELYVDPDSFAKGLKPKTPLRPAKLDKVEVPEGATTEGFLAINPKKLGKLTTDAVAKMVEGAGHTVSEASDDGIAFTVGESGWTGLMNLVLRDGNRFVRVVDIGTVSAEVPVVSDAPEGEDAEAPAAPDEATDEGEAGDGEDAVVETERIKVGYAPKTLAAAGAGSVLPVDNARSSWAEVTINGEKVGIIGPYATGYVHNVTAGAYEIGFTWANGFSLATTANTLDKPDPLPRSPGITPLGMPAPGVPAR